MLARAVPNRASDDASLASASVALSSAATARSVPARLLDLLAPLAPARTLGLGPGGDSPATTRSPSDGTFRAASGFGKSSTDLQTLFAQPLARCPHCAPRDADHESPPRAAAESRDQLAYA